jgi:hypothetical protein
MVNSESELFTQLQVHDFLQDVNEQTAMHNAPMRVIFFMWLKKKGSEEPMVEYD